MIMQLLRQRMYYISRDTFTTDGNTEWFQTLGKITKVKE